MIIVAKDKLTWRREVDEEETREALSELKYAWGLGKEGPELHEGIEDCYNLLADGMVSDLEALWQLGAEGYVIFVDQAIDRPFIKAFISPSGLTWFTAEDVTGLTLVNIDEL